MTAQQIKERIESLSDETQAEVMDTTGTGDHYHAVVISPLFEGKRTIQRHQMVFSLLQPELQSGELHAIELKTLTPTEYDQI